MVSVSEQRNLTSFKIWFVFLIVVFINKFIKPQFICNLLNSNDKLPYLLLYKREAQK